MNVKKAGASAVPAYPLLQYRQAATQTAQPLNPMTTKSLSLCAVSAALTIVATAAAILTPVTPENRRPMGAMLSLRTLER